MLLQIYYFLKQFKPMHPETTHPKLSHLRLNGDKLTRTCAIKVQDSLYIKRGKIYVRANTDYPPQKAREFFNKFLELQGNQG